MKHSDYEKLDRMAADLGLEVEYLLVEKADGRDYIMLYDGEELVAEGSYEVVHNYLNGRMTEVLSEIASLLSEGTGIVESETLGTVAIFEIRLPDMSCAAGEVAFSWN